MPNEAAIHSLPKLLWQFGRVLPEDVSVVAICPDQLALQSSPQLTSVSIPAEEMGRTDLELVMATRSDHPLIAEEDAHRHTEFGPGVR